MSDIAPSFLYVDDDSMSREVMRILLEKVMGFSQTSYFADSEAFVARLEQLPYVPTVIFLDIRIRPLSGYQMLEIIRQNSAYQNSKIVAVTANVMAPDVVKMKESGFDGLIGKPIINRVFPDLLNKILSGEPIWYIS